MGDMADYALEQVEYYENRRAEYHGGLLTDVEACDEGIIDELGYEHLPGNVASAKTCRCCGKRGLHWGVRNGKWRLFSNHGLHRCKANPLQDNFRAAKSWSPSKRRTS